MKKFILMFGLMLFLSSCEYFDKEKKAIHICQNSNFQMQTDNIFRNLFSKVFLGLNEDSTWLDFANMLAQEDPNKKYKWSAQETETQDVYIVSFTDEKGWGHRWEVTIDEQIVKYINRNEYLCRKYGLSRKSNTDDFAITDIKTDTLRFYKKYKSSKPEIIYEFKGSVVNNTDKSIINAKLKGSLKLIFEAKTIEVNSGLYDGFLKKISKSRPWKPGEKRKFKIKTYGIEKVYANYIPPYVFFEIALIAEDPTGYNFDENIKEVNLKEKWEKHIFSEK